MPEILSVGPKDLEWLGQTLKLDTILSTQPALEEILRSFPAISFQKWSAGQEIVKEGDTTKDFYVLFEGRLSVWHKGDAPEEEKVGELCHGEFFGEIGFLMKSARSATVKTECECRVFRLPAEEFASLLVEHKVFQKWVKSIASERIIKLLKKG